MPPTALELVQLSLVLVSIPVYLWFLFTIVRFRKKKPFDSSFFTLCLVLGFCDLESLFGNWVFGKFPTFGWFKLDVMVRKYNGQMGKLHALFTIHGYLQQFTGVALMAFNRCTALAFFHKHKKVPTVIHLIGNCIQIWSSPFLYRALTFEILAPFLALLPALLTPDI